jgi:hypothetical protein
MPPAAKTLKSETRKAEEPENLISRTPKSAKNFHRFGFSAAVSEYAGTTFYRRPISAKKISRGCEASWLFDFRGRRTCCGGAAQRILCGLTFELSGRQRWDARPAKWMIACAASRAWWPAVGAPLERGVRPHLARLPRPPEFASREFAVWLLR